jgi:hypothetical protein
MSTAHDQQHTAGIVDPDANPPFTNPFDDEIFDELILDGPGDLPPQDTGQTVPPYDGRTTSTA